MSRDEGERASTRQKTQLMMVLWWRATRGGRPPVSRARHLRFLLGRPHLLVTYLLSPACHPMIQESAGCLILQELHRFVQQPALRIDDRDKPVVAPPENKPFVHSGPFRSARHGRFRARHHDWLGCSFCRIAAACRCQCAPRTMRRRAGRAVVPHFHYKKLTMVHQLRSQEISRFTASNLAGQPHAMATKGEGASILPGRRELAAERRRFG